MKFPIAMMPLKAKAAIEAQAELGNYPIESVATAALAIMAYAAQGQANVEDPSQHGKAYPCSQLYLVLVKSGDAKSAIFMRLMRGVDRWKIDETKKYEVEQQDYEIDFSEWERSYKEAQKENDPRTRRYDLKQLADRKPQPPRHRQNVLSKVTTNGIFRNLEVGYPTIGLFADEGATVLSGHSLRAENSPMEFASTLTTLFDRGSADRTTGEKTVYLNGCRLSGLIMVQPEVAREFVTNTMFKQQGLHARFAIVQSSPWDMVIEDFTDPALLTKRERLARLTDEFCDRIYSILSRPLPVGETPWVLEPPTLTWSDDAKRRGVDIARECRVLRDEHDEPYWKRLFEHVCRTAGVLAVFEGHDQITTPVLNAAYEIVIYYAEQWVNLSIGGLDAKDSKNAQYFDNIIQTLNGNGSLSRRDLFRKSNGLSKMDVRRQNEIMNDMIDNEMVEAFEVTNGTRKTVHYRVMP